MAKKEQSAGAVVPGQPFELKELVRYAPGAIVSRVLTKNDHCNLTLFAFDAGQGLTEHTSPFDAYVLLLDGKMQITVGGKPEEPVAGEALLMPAMVPHALHAPVPAKVLLVMVRSQVG
jgi:quercetin dioxygenase-like cupin family protein